MFEVYSLWPQPIARKKYHNHIAFKEKVLNFMEQNKDIQVDDASYPNQLKHFFQGPPPYDELDFFEYIKDDDFENFLKESAKIFMGDILGLNLQSDVIITDCWINNCSEGGQQKLHKHGNSFVSGTYYLNYDPENHAHLKFENPYTSKFSPYMALDIENITDFNHQESFCTFIKEGDLVLWQSFLSHGYDINKKNERISISMNFLPNVLKCGPYSFKIQK